MADQSGLGAAERFANLAGSLHCPTPGLRAAPGAGGRRCAPWSATTCSPRAPPPARPSGRSRRWAARSTGIATAAATRRRRPRGQGPRGRRQFFGSPFIRRDERLASVHGVRPGPWLRRPGQRGARSRAPAGKPMPVAGETAHVRPSASRGGRSRCGLDVSPASPPPSDRRRYGRRSVVARKLREPQQATVGTKTRSAGRAPSSRDVERSTRASGMGRDRRSSSELKEVQMDVVVTGTALRGLGQVPKPRQRQAREAREARSSDHPRAGRGRQGSKPPPVRPRRPRRAHRLLQGPGDPGRGRRRRQDGRARPRRRQDGRPDAPRRRPPPRPPRPGHQGRDRRRARRARRAERGRRAGRRRGRRHRGADPQVGPITVTGEGPLVVREKTHAAAR